MMRKDGKKGYRQDYRIICTINTDRDTFIEHFQSGKTCNSYDKCECN